MTAGVRTIEHGNLIDAPTAQLMAERGAYLVPTLVAYDALKRRGPDYGLSSYSLAKNELVLHAGLRSLEIARAAGVKIGFGSDLLGQLQNDHCNEFTMRREAMSAPDIIRSATLVNAEIVRQEGKLGELIPGAHADLLVVDGDPYRDISVLLGDGRNIAAIMLGGRFIKNIVLSDQSRASRRKPCSEARLTADRRPRPRKKSCRIFPSPRLHLVRRPGRAYRLFPHRVRRTPPLGVRRRLRRSRRTLPVHAGPGIEPARHVDRPVARRTTRHVRRLGRLHPAVRAADARFAYGVEALGDVGNAAWLKGLKLVAVAVVAQAVWGMAQSLAPDRPARNARSRRRTDRARSALVARPDRAPSCSARSSA